MSAPSPSDSPVEVPVDPPRWRRVRAVTAGLLVVWFVATFGTSFFARDLDAVWFGWPLNWWIASQGALLLYVGVIAAYAWAMSRFDDDADADPGAG